MSTLPSVPRPLKHSAQASIDDADVKVDDSKMVRSPKATDCLNSNSHINGPDSKLLTSRDLNKITNQSKSEIFNESKSDPEDYRISRNYKSPTNDVITTSEHFTPLQHKSDRTTSSAALLSPLMPLPIPEGISRSTRPPVIEECLPGDLMQLKIEQERTKQMQLKCELSKSVADLLKKAESKGEVAELIRRLFFDESQESSEATHPANHAQSSPTSTLPSGKGRNTHHHTNIVIPEPHLAPSPGRLDDLVPTRKAFQPITKVKHEHGYSYEINKSCHMFKKADLVSQKQQGNVEETLETNHHSPMSDVEGSAPKSAIDSNSGSRAPSIGGSGCSSLLSDQASGASTLMTPVVHSVPMTRKQTQEPENRKQDSTGGHTQAIARGVTPMYPIYYAHPNYGYTSEHQRYYMTQDARPAVFNLQDDKQTGGQPKTLPSQIPSNVPTRVQTPLGSEHPQGWHKKHQVHQHQPTERSATQVSQENCSALVYTDPIQTSEIGAVTNGNEAAHTQQRTPQNSPQQGQPVYYVHPTPMTIPGNNSYAPSHYFIPPPLQPGMVSWVPTSVIPEKRREEEDIHTNKKRRALKSGISFMISTPQNPPARKYNKLQ